MTSTTIDRDLLSRFERLYNEIAETMGELRERIGVQPSDEQQLLAFKPVISTPVGNLTATLKNTQIYDGRLQGYYRVEYMDGGKKFEQVARYEIGRNGRPVLGKILTPRVSGR